MPAVSGLRKVGSTVEMSKDGKEFAQEKVTVEKGLGEKVTRRSVLGAGAGLLGAGVLGSSLLAACGGGGTAQQSGPVTIVYAALADQTGEQKAQIAKFNEKFSGKIKVNYEELPPVATDQYSKFVNAFKAKKGTPDVVHIDVTWPTQFASSGWLAPIDSYVDANYLKEFWPSATGGAKIDGKLYGIQRYMDIGLLYYRTDLVEKYGGVVPQTRKQLEEIAQKIVAGEAKNGVKYGYLIPGKKIEAIVCQWLEFIWGVGGTIGEPGNFTVNGPDGISALSYLNDLIYSKKLVPSGTNTYAPNDILSLFGNGQAPFMRNWTYAYAIANNPAKSKVAGKVGIAPVIGDSGKGVGCSGGWVLSINAQSKQKDAAWEFIKFLLSKETQTSLSQNAGLVSSRPDVVNDPALQEKLPQFKQLGAILDAGRNRPQLKSYNQFTTPLQSAINSVLSNQQKADAALTAAQAQVGKLV